VTAWGERRGNAMKQEGGSSYRSAVSAKAAARFGSTSPDQGYAIAANEDRLYVALGYQGSLVVDSTPLTPQYFQGAVLLAMIP
jgi:hypothetical protein